VQHDVVLLETDRAEDAALGARRIVEHAQRLVAVTRDHHLVERFGRAPLRFDLDDGVAATDAAHRTRRPDATAQRCGEALEVARRAAAHDAPLRLIAKRKQPVVVKEAHERARRELEEARRIG
jgi:hypothetical protein